MLAVGATLFLFTYFPTFNVMAQDRNVSENSTTSETFSSELNTVLGMVGSCVAAGVAMRFKTDKADINIIMDATVVGALSVARFAEFNKKPVVALVYGIVFGLLITVNNIVISQRSKLVAMKF